MSTFLMWTGYVLVVLGIIAAAIALLVAVKEAMKPSQPAEGDIRTSMFDPVEAVKALAAAPLWLALIAGGVGMIVLGSLYDGWRFADGGLTQEPPAVTRPATPTPES